MEKRVAGRTVKAEGLVKVREAAQLLGVSVRTLYAWMSGGRVQSVRFGKRCTRIPMAEVERLMRDGL